MRTTSGQINTGTVFLFSLHLILHTLHNIMFKLDCQYFTHLKYDNNLYYFTIILIHAHHNHSI